MLFFTTEGKEKYAKFTEIYDLSVFVRSVFLNSVYSVVKH